MAKKRCNSWRNTHRCVLEQRHVGEHFNANNRASNDGKWQRGGVKKEKRMQASSHAKEIALVGWTKRLMELEQFAVKIESTVESLALEVSALRAERGSMVERIEKLEKDHQGIASIESLLKQKVQVDAVTMGGFLERLEKLDADSRKDIVPLQIKVQKIDDIQFKVTKTVEKVAELINRVEAVEGRPPFCGDLLNDGVCFPPNKCDRPYGHGGDHADRTARWSQAGVRQHPVSATGESLLKTIGEETEQETRKTMRKLAVETAVYDHSNTYRPVSRGPQPPDQFIRNCDPLLTLIVKEQTGVEHRVPPLGFLLIDRASVYVRVEQPAISLLPPTPQK